MGRTNISKNLSEMERHVSMSSVTDIKVSERVKDISSSSFLQREAGYEEELLKEKKSGWNR